MAHRRRRVPPFFLIFSLLSLFLAVPRVDEKEQESVETGP